jgi:hypothetical protein
MDCHPIAASRKMLGSAGLRFRSNLGSNTSPSGKVPHQLDNKQNRRSLQRGDKRFLTPLE